MRFGKRTWYEFFAGGGMARLGLSSEWNCAFNEWSPKKAAVYRAVFGDGELRVCDIADLTARDLPGFPTLAWASFPCQDDCLRVVERDSPESAVVRFVRFGN